MSILAWIFPLGSGLLDAWNRKIAKESSASRFAFVAFGMLFAIPYFLVWLFFDGVREISTSIWWILLLHGSLLTFLNWLIVEAHRLGDMTAVGSYFSLTPAFALVASPFLFGFPAGNLWGIIGVLVLVGGLYLLQVLMALLVL